MDGKKKTDLTQMNGVVEAQEPDEKPDDRFPRSIPFIIGNEFCERFCYYGMRAVLTLYFVNVFKYDESKATEGFHLFAMCAYFTPLLGAFIADSYLGKYLTILYLSIVYVAGNLLLSSASYLQSEILTITGLGFIALGTGGIKPCVSAFGGDQFKKNQAHLLDKFFSLFYLSINLGSVVSMFVTPIFRSDISCFGQPSCYPLAFGVPALLMIIALVLFLVGSPLYVKLPSAKGNVVVQFVSCIIYSLYKKMTNLFSGEPKPSHFLEYSASKYPSNIIEDGKSVLSVFLLFIPLPIFWSLYDQQGSTFVLQAQHTNGDVGILNWNYTLRPDQFQVINPLLVILLIPVFDYVIYPTLKKFNFCTKPLQKMGLGGLLAAFAFVCAALLQLHIENSKVVAPIEGQTNVNLILLNSKPITSVDLWNPNEHLLKINDELNNRFIDFGTISADNYTLNAQLASEMNFTFTERLNLSEKSVNTVVIYETKDGLATLVDAANEIKANYSKLQLKIYLNQDEYIKNVGQPVDFIMIKGVGEPIALTVDPTPLFWTKTIELDEIVGGYDILIDDKSIFKFTGQEARSYKLAILAKDKNKFDVSKYEWINFKQVSMGWQFVQYIVLTASEIAFSITGLNFSYSEAPVSMKSVVTAAWLFTTALGNFLVVLITSLAQFDSPANQFLFYGFLMFVDILLFIILAYFYKPRTPSNIAEEKEVLELRNSGESLDKNNLAN